MTGLLEYLKGVRYLTTNKKKGIEMKKKSRVLIWLLVSIFLFSVKGTQAQNEDDPIGRPYRGVQAYSNGGNFNTKNFQCTEYVMRFYRIIFHVEIQGRGWGNASGFFSGGAKDENFSAYPNGSIVPPQPDQILCYGGGRNGYGHVAIITEVNIGAGYIKIIDQNRHRSNPYLEIPISVSNDRYYISNQGLGSSYYVQG